MLWNFDETRLFWKMLPSKSYAMAGKERHGLSKYKDSMTIAFFVNSCGDRLRPVIIGKHAKPRCFKSLNYDKTRLSVDYYSSESSFITRDIFEKILSNWHHKLLDENQRAILVIDNATVHEKIDMTKYQTIELQFLPPRTTSIIQPLDQGIIRSFKARYIAKLLNYVIGQYERENSTKSLGKNISLLDAVNWSSQSWSEISDTCIINCWRKAGFERTESDMPVLMIDPEDCDDRYTEAFKAASSLFSDSISYNSYIEEIECRYRRINLQGKPHYR